MTSASTRILVALAGFGSVAGMIIFAAASASTGRAVTSLAWAALPVVSWAVGALIVLRARMHPVGLLLTLAGAFGGLVMSGVGFVTNAAFVAMPVTPWALLFVTATYGPWLVTLILASMVLFPDGRLPGPAWRWAVLGPILMVAVATVAWVLRPGPFRPGMPDNPVGIEWLPAGLLESLYFLAPLGIASLAVVGAASLLTRFRRGTASLRAQLKWLLAFVVPVIIFMPIGFFETDQAADSVADVLSSIALLLVPIAVGIAILRYRLYDIDRLISRTLAYTALTATLAIVYIAAFVGLQATLTPVTSSGGSLAVAASTLVVLALFQPLRRRLQSAMDRRFNRSRYDAQRTVEAFANRLRDEVDLGMVQAEVLATVNATVQPNRATVWLREPVG